MKKSLYFIFTILLYGILAAQQGTNENEDSPVNPETDLPVVQVEIQFQDASFFVETPATCMIVLPDDVENPIVELSDSVNFQLLDYTMLPASRSKIPTLELRWFPLEEGLHTFPSIRVKTDKEIYQSTPSQVLIKAPTRSENLSLSFKPAKTSVYEGEPLRVDVIWRADISTKRIRSLECYPAFFNNPEMEISVPRSTDPESKQIGLPFGGRRIIARRDKNPDNESILGTITFPIFIIFEEPGSHQMDRVRLNCNLLQQDGGPLAPYAAYYNNGLFERIEKGSAYEKIYTYSEPVQIEVLPLPEQGRTENFSGLFLPCEITASINPDESTVGQLMSLDLTVKSPTASDLLQLPSLTKQKGLRSWFKVDPDYTRTWMPDGANFTARLRALTTRVKAIPGLQFQVFDPETGEYKLLKTSPIPLNILPQDGKDYFDSKVLLDTTTNLTSQADGIWNNRGKRPMHDLLDTVLSTTAAYFWLFILMGPLMFILLLPRILERRRQENDPVYRRQISAYRKFTRFPEGDTRKWDALKELIATSMGAEPGSWTIGDSMKKLKDARCDQKAIDAICECHRILDSKDYSTGKAAFKLPALKPVGQHIFKSLSKLSILVVMILIGTPSPSEAQMWSTAESAFQEAMEMEAGTVEYYAAFSDAALQYESAARAGEHPGLAWYNAGNSWFFAGEIGRSIACYKQASEYRPFDPLVRKNLNAARALAIDVVEQGDQAFWLSWPMRLVAIILVISNLFFWGFLLAYFRYRTRRMLISAVSLLAINLLLGMLGIYNAIWRNPPGVVIATEIFARKGPGYNYQTAFYEPLHDGLEFKVLESRNGWLNIMLTDGRNCWIPESQTQLIDLSF